MLPVRRRFLRQRSAAVTLRAGERGRRARKGYRELKQRHHAALKIQVWEPSLHLTQISA
jgi:hypothetical protein